MIKEAVRHRGFALIDILQPCPTFNHLNTYSWYKERVYKLNEKGDHDVSDMLAAFKKAQEWGESIPIGVFYKEERAALEEQISAIREMPLVKQKIEPRQFEKLIQEFI